jgi:hypothetical protein
VLDHPFWIDMRKHRSKKSMLRGQERVDSPSQTEGTYEI